MPLVQRLPLLLVLGCAPHIPEPLATSGAAALDPVAPSSLRVCWLEFARGTMPRVAVAHGAVDAAVDGTQSGLLVEGPRGTWLIDGGPSASSREEAHEVHGTSRFLLEQAMRGWTQVVSPAKALAASRVYHMTGTIATHTHYDHVGGLLDLPDLPVYVGAEELGRAAFGVLPAELRALGGRGRPIPFTDTPFLLWDQSFDVFRDQSLIVFPLPGHTPGSVGVRVRLPSGKALLLVGDTVWLREGYEAREPKSVWTAGFDADPEGTATQIARLWQLHQQSPEVVILPAHDRRAWVEAFGAPGCL